MLEFPQTWTQALESSDPEIRLANWDRIFGAHREEFYGFFARFTAHLDADDLTHQLYFRIYRRLNSGALPADNFPGYLWRSESNLLNEYGRRVQKNYRQVPLEQVADSQPARQTEEAGEGWLVEQENLQRLIDLTLRLPDSLDRLILTLKRIGYTPEQIALLTPLSARSVRRRLRRSAEIIRRQWDQSPDGVRTAGSWEALLLSDGGLPFWGVSFINAHFEQFSPDAERELQHTFGVTKPADRERELVSTIMVHAINTHEPMPCLSFMPRSYVNPLMVEGNWVPYVDYRAVFEVERVGGRRQERLLLVDKREYRGRVIEKHFDPQGKPLGYTWLFDHPEGPVTAFKPFEADFLWMMYTDAGSREPMDMVFQPKA